MLYIQHRRHVQRLHIAYHRGYTEQLYHCLTHVWNRHSICYGYCALYVLCSKLYVNSPVYTHMHTYMTDQYQPNTSNDCSLDNTYSRRPKRKIMNMMIYHPKHEYHIVSSPGQMLVALMWNPLHSACLSLISP